VRAQRPLATGAALTEAELAAVLQVDLEEWRRMVEALTRAQSARPS
jgi:DNA-directed RNA polymerase specialized sigma subunit